MCVVPLATLHILDDSPHEDFGTNTLSDMDATGPSTSTTTTLHRKEDNGSHLGSQGQEEECPMMIPFHDTLSIPPITL